MALVAAEAVTAVVAAAVVVEVAVAVAARHTCAEVDAAVVDVPRVSRLQPIGLEGRVHVLFVSEQLRLAHLVQVGTLLLRHNLLHVVVVGGGGAAGRRRRRRGRGGLETED